VRVYLLLLLGFFIAFFLFEKYNPLMKWLSFSVISISVFFYLVFFMKVTESIFLGIFSSIFFAFIFCLREQRFKRNLVGSLYFLILIMSSLWMTVQLVKINKSNIANTRLTRCDLQELMSHQKFLFINSDNTFHDKGFSIWDSPSKYPVTNLINKELLLTNSYLKVLKRYTDESLMESLTNKNILLLGEHFPLLNEYYLFEFNQEIKLQKMSGFKCLNVYRATTLPSD